MRNAGRLGSGFEPSDYFYSISPQTLSDIWTIPFAGPEAVAQCI